LKPLELFHVKICGLTVKAEHLLGVASEEIESIAASKLCIDCLQGINGS
jgi:hypothetical protein